MNTIIILFKISITLVCSLTAVLHYYRIIIINFYFISYQGLTTIHVNMCDENLQA